MIRYRHNVRPYLKVFDDLGIDIVDTRVNGRSHYEITVTSQGTTCFFVAPRSASDHRALQNFRSQVKRWKRSLETNVELEFS
jgi:hypothetical protein